MIKEVKIGDYCLIGDGTHSSIKRIDSGIMYLSSKNFSKEGISLDKVDYISEEDYKKYFKISSKALTKPQKNDLIFSIIGSIGGVYLYKENDCFGLSSSVAMIRVNSEELKAEYLFYYLKSEFLQKWAEIIKSGSAQGFLSLVMIRNLPLVLPPLKTQKKIASILSNYDNLIENNNQRIKLLESMAEEIYKEWFVRLRFPEFEKVKVVDGVPEGWERKELGEIYNTSSGGTPNRKKEQYYNGNILWIKTGELKETFVLDTNEKITENALENSSAKYFPENTIVIAMYCAMPDLSILVYPSSTNQACCAFLPKQEKINYCFSYMFIKYAQKGLITHAQGSAQQNLSQEIICKYKVILPPMDLIIKYGELTYGFFEKIKVLMKKNKNLKETRDLLLPKLINGTLKVE